MARTFGTRQVGSKVVTAKAIAALGVSQLTGGCARQSESTTVTIVSTVTTVTTPTPAREVIATLSTPTPIEPDAATGATSQPLAQPSTRRERVTTLPTPRPATLKAAGGTYDPKAKQWDFTGTPGEVASSILGKIAEMKLPEFNQEDDDNARKPKTIDPTQDPNATEAERTEAVATASRRSERNSRINSELQQQALGSGLNSPRAIKGKSGATTFSYGEHLRPEHNVKLNSSTKAALTKRGDQMAAHVTSLTIESASVC